MSGLTSNLVLIVFSIAGLAMSAWYLRIEFVRPRERTLKRRAEYIERLEKRLRELYGNDQLTEEDFQELLSSVRRAMPVDPRDSQLSWVFTGMAALLGVISVGSLLLWIVLKWPAEKILLWPFVSLNPIGPAMAATTLNPDSSSLAPFIPYFLGAVLLTMFIAFISAIVVLFKVPDTPENQTRLKAAGDLVKTFGGFFTGIATTLMH